METIDRKVITIKYHVEGLEPVKQAHDSEWCDLRSAETVELKKQISKEYLTCLTYFGCNYSELDNEKKKELGALVNNTKSLAALVNTTVKL